MHPLICIGLCIHSLFIFYLSCFSWIKCKKQGLAFRVRRQLRSMSAALIIKRENSLIVSRASHRAHKFKKKTKKRWLPSPSDHVASVLLNLVFILSKLRKKNSLPHLKIWMLLVNLFDLIRAPREGLFLLIEGVYMLRAHNIPYY